MKYLTKIGTVDINPPLILTKELSADDDQSITKYNTIDGGVMIISRVKPNSAKKYNFVSQENQYLNESVVNAIKVIAKSLSSIDFTIDGVLTSLRFDVDEEGSQLLLTPIANGIFSKYRVSIKAVGI